MSGHKLYTTPNYFKLNAQSIKLFQVEHYYAKYIVGLWLNKKEQKLASHARILPDALSTKKIEELSKFHDGLLMKDHDKVKRNKKPKSTINGFTWQKWPKTIKKFLIVLVK